MADETLDSRRKRLRYRAWHRGTREMDLLMGQFADKLVETFCIEELDQFEALLMEADTDLYNWFIGREPVPSDHPNPMLPRFIGFKFAPKDTTD